MAFADVFYHCSREQRHQVSWYWRFTHDTDSVRADPTLGGPELRGNRFRRSPSFKRVVSIAADMAAAPNQSLPTQCADWPDLKAAYRFLNHPDVTPERIQGTHRQQTRQLCQKHKLILAIEDCTELDFTSHPATEGLGPIGDGHGRGILQHSTLAATPDGHVLGVLHQIFRNRVPAKEGETRRERRERPKESDFWHESVEAVGALGPETRLVHVADRGGDDFSMMVACGHHEVGFLVRAQHDRCINDGTNKLWSYMEAQAIAGDRDVPVPARDGQPARVARLAVRFSRVRLDPPKGDPRFQEPLEVWVVSVIEENPPKNIEAIEWMLLTSEAISSREQACERVDWYACRWVIEEWHKAEKTGCRLEASQLKDAEAIRCLASFIAVIAVRMLQLRDLAQMATVSPVKGRNSSADRPEALRAVVPYSWLIVVAHLATCRPEKLTPRQFWLTIAKRGGFIGRKGDGLPGWQTIWRGWYDVMMMVRGVEMCTPHPDAETYG